MDESSTSRPPKSASGRFFLLDALRGLAAISVVGYHATMQYGELRGSIAAEPSAASTSEWLIYFCGLGYLGVPIFFMISGYCICAAAVNHRNKNYPISRFFKRRFRRIYPPYWCCIALFSLLCLAGIPIYPGALSATQWLGNILLFEEWRPYVFGPEKKYLLAVAWTLCYEEQFYLFVGLILALCPRALFPAFAAVTAFALWNNYHVYLQSLFPSSQSLKLHVDGLILDSYWLFFASGIGLFLYRNCNHGLRHFFPLVLLALTLWEFRQFDWHTNRFASRTATFTITFLLCWISRFDGRLSASRFLKPVFWLGTRTYSIYLVHLPFVQLLVTAERSFDASVPTFTLLFTVPIAIATSVMVGAVFYHYVERRFVPS